MVKPTDPRTYLLLRHPSANRVYASEAGALAAAELAITCPFVGQVDQRQVAHLDYLSFVATPLSDEQLSQIAGLSAFLGLFELCGDDLLRPVVASSTDVLSDDLVTIPKYQGKTNEQFTRLMLNVALAAAQVSGDRPRTILDPMAGRATTLSTAWLMGHHAYGVEQDAKAFELYTSFLKTWLRRKRIKHSADVAPVRREGKMLGKKLTASFRTDQHEAQLIFFTGDGRNAKELFGKKRFDVIATDAPYGVIHGAATGKGTRERNPADLLAEAVPIWASQLTPGGVLAIAWNTYSLTREELSRILSQAGLQVHDDGPWLQFAHRVDSSIKRDLIVAVNATTPLN